MKKYICLLFIALLVFSSCSPNKTDESSETMGIKYNNTVPYEQMITKEYDAKDFDFYIPYSSSIAISSWIPILDDINREHPIECFRKIDIYKNEDSFYAIYKINGGILFVFFLKKSEFEYLSSSDYRAVACLNMSKELVESNFSKIHKGSMADEVVAIDPSTILYELDDNTRVSNHLLLDGSVFDITYEKINDEWVVFEYSVNYALAKDLLNAILPIDRV